MTEHSGRARVVKFGTFELDVAAGELRKNGLRLRLQEQPFRLLALLVERPGELVGREELREKLWPSDTFVDFDNSLNTAASKLREALGDSASSPRFIETLPRRGYRFLASVEKVGEDTEHGGPDRSDVIEGVPEPDAHQLNKQLRNQQMGGMAIVTLLLVVIAVMWVRSPTPVADAPLRRFVFRTVDALAIPLISPNGLHIAYTMEQALWVQDLDHEEPRKLVELGPGFPHINVGLGLAWSPDSKNLTCLVGSQLRRVPIDGGPSTLIHDLGERRTLFSGATWSFDSRSIVFSGPGRGVRNALYRVSSPGGTPEILFEPGSLETSPPGYLAPEFLPRVGNQQGILYARSRSGLSETQIVARDLETGREEVLANGHTPVYSVTGHVLYQSPEGPTLWAVPFSLETLRKVGDPFVIRENASLPSVSRDGTLVYKDHSGTTGVHLAWFNRSGTNLSLIGQPQQSIIYAAIAPDEDRVAVAGGQAGKGANIWIHDVNRPIKTLFSSSGMNPIWARSGKEILFSSGRNGNLDIYRKQIDGGQEEKLLFSTEASEFASDWSADGKYAFYDLDDPAPPADIWYLTLRNDGGIEAKPFLATPFEEKAARISPDGLWVAYVANESGAYEIYVRRFPEGGGKERVSVYGGTGPRWRRDGRKLYYVERDTLMEVDVESGPNLSMSEPKALFATPGLSVSGSEYPHYDVSADGQRFVVPVPVGKVSIRVVQNWFAEFRDTAK